LGFDEETVGVVSGSHERREDGHVRGEAALDVTGEFGGDFDDCEIWGGAFCLCEKAAEFGVFAEAGAELCGGDKGCGVVVNAEDRVEELGGESGCRSVTDDADGFCRDRNAAAEDGAADGAERFSGCGF